MRLSLLLALLALPPLVLANGPPAQKEKDAGKSYAIPCRLTDSGHILIRAKINGKGPFNFIVDTGAPLVYVTVPVAKQLGIKPAKKGMATLDTLQVEGGPVQEKFQVVIETPFQLEGMNAMGLPGVELHGIIGYTLLSHYKLEFDPTKDRMTWTKLDFTPAAPQSLGVKGSAEPGLDNLGKLMKMFAALMGIKGAPEPALRGFIGVELDEMDNAVVVKTVLAKGPAALAGLAVGDRVTAVQGKEVTTPVEVRALLAKVVPGQQVSFVVRRADDIKEISITAGEGI
jgi:PDZ domain/Aspartyl protease